MHDTNLPRILGTPDEEDWPGVTSLPDYKSTFPQWSATPLKKTVSHMDANGLELLALMLKYDPAQRISGKFGQSRDFGLSSADTQ